MRRKGSSRKREVPIGYVVADPNGNRASRRMAAKEAKAAAKGRVTGHSTGAAPTRPLVAADSDLESGES
jgi:hypothetical protein